MIRVFLADDHTIIRDGIKRLIEETPDLALAGETGKGRDVLRRVAKEEWDVLLLDISLPDLSGIEILRQLRSLVPKLPVIILSMYAEEQYAARILRMGAAAYLSKGRSSQELLAAIRTVAAGRRYVTAAAADALILMGAGGEGAPHERLSPREHELFLLIIQGRSPGDIAAELNVSASTVSSHLARIREKLGVRTNGEVIQYAWRAGLTAEQG